MAGLIQKAVNSLFVKDSDTSRVRDNIVTALNPVLTFLISNFAQNGPVLQVLKALQGTSATFSGPISAAACTLAGDMVVGGRTNLAGNTTIRGNVVVYPATGNGFVITPPVTGAAFYVTNVAGNSPRFIIDESGAVFSADSIAGATFKSAAGFKTVLFCGTHWNNGYGANGLNPIQLPVVNGNGGGLGATPFIYRWTHEGSVVGASLVQAGPVMGTNYLQILKNGVVQYTWTCGYGGNTTVFSQPFTKGVIPFAAGDNMALRHYVNVSGNTQVSVHLTLEMAA